MITELDDLTIHQGYGTMDHVESGDPRWFDKLWFHVGVASGDLSVAGHMGVYPNTNTMDAAGAIRAKGCQWNVLASRELQRDRDNRKVGPFSAEIVEHFKRWRFVMKGEGDAPSYEIEFLSDHYPMELTAPVFHRRDGRHITWNMWHYVQTGRMSGTVSAGGQTWQLNEEQAYGVRDRSWGVRPIFGQVPKKAPLPDNIARSSLWLAARFPDRDLWLWLMEPENPMKVRVFGNLSDESGRVRVDGAVAGSLESDGPLTRIISVEPRLRFQGKQLSGGSVVAGDSEGNRHDISIRPLGIIYAQGLGYGNPQFRHMEFKGAKTLSEVYDLRDETQTAKLTENPSGHINPFGVEQFCEFEAKGAKGYGVVRLNI